MWKAILPAVIALVTLGLSLVSGEAVKRESEHKQVIALAQTTESAKAKVDDPVTTATTPHGSGHPVALLIGNSANPDAGLPLAKPVNNAGRSPPPSKTRDSTWNWVRISPSRPWRTRSRASRARSS